MHWTSVAILALMVVPALASERVSAIQFFGYKGIDVEVIRKALPVHEGDEYSDATKELARQAVVASIGREATDVQGICCDENHNRLLFIGIPGGSYKSFTYNPEPKSSARVSAEIMDLSSRVDQAARSLQHSGAELAPEDDSHGYALYGDSNIRSLLLEERRYALKHERELYRALEFSSDAEHRQVASEALGYARQTPRQVHALVRAARDSDDDVRNNATRALGVLAGSNKRLAREIAPGTFVEMLNSGVWTDRNKGAALLERLTADRNPALLSELRTEALDSLVEMASWRGPGHSYFARMLLGRIAGIPEDRLIQLAVTGSGEAIIEAVGRR